MADADQQRDHGQGEYRAVTREPGEGFRIHPFVDGESGRCAGIDVDLTGFCTPRWSFDSPELASLIDLLFDFLSHAEASDLRGARDCGLEVWFRVQPSAVDVDCFLIPFSRLAEVLPCRLGLRLVSEGVEHLLEHQLSGLFWLRDQGIPVALEDVSTGERDFDRLRVFPFAGVSVDAALFGPLESDPRAPELFASMVLMYSRLGMSVRAHGVKRQGQAAALADLGVLRLQGDYYAPAMAVDGLWQWMSSGTCC